MTEPGTHVGRGTTETNGPDLRKDCPTNRPTNNPTGTNDGTTKQQVDINIPNSPTSQDVGDPPGKPTPATPLADLVADVRARRAEQRAVRGEFAARRAYGLARRHRAKLAHFAKHGYPAELADLQAKIAARANPPRETDD